MKQKNFLLTKHQGPTEKYWHDLVVAQGLYKMTEKPYSKLWLKQMRLASSLHGTYTKLVHFEFSSRCWEQK